jgi:hypothetical protein
MRTRFTNKRFFPHVMADKNYKEPNKMYQKVKLFHSCLEFNIRKFLDLIILAIFVEEYKI